MTAPINVAQLRLSSVGVIMRHARIIAIAKYEGFDANAGIRS